MDNKHIGLWEAINKFNLPINDKVLIYNNIINGSKLTKNEYLSIREPVLHFTQSVFKGYSTVLIDKNVINNVTDIKLGDLLMDALNNVRVITKEIKIPTPDYTTKDGYLLEDEIRYGYINKRNIFSVYNKNLIKEYVISSASIELDVLNNEEVNKNDILISPYGLHIIDNIEITGNSNDIIVRTLYDFHKDIRPRHTFYMNFDDTVSFDDIESVKDYPEVYEKYQNEQVLIIRHNEFFKHIYNKKIDLFGDIFDHIRDNDKIFARSRIYNINYYNFKNTENFDDDTKHEFYVLTDITNKVDPKPM